MLRWIKACVSYEQTVDIVAHNSAIVQAVIKCIASHAELTVMAMIMDVLTVLLQRGDGEAIKPHAQVRIVI